MHTKQYRHSTIFATAIALSVAAALLLSAGCNAGGKSFGDGVPSNVPVVKLVEIVGDPAAYDGKEVVLEGTLTGQCAALCDFTYAEGTTAASVFLEGFKPPRIKTGTKVRIYARITGSGGRAVISARGLHLPN